METDIISDRFDIDPDSPYLGDFEEYIWYNSELCNNCFTVVRDVGPEVARSAESQTYYINAWYERTDQGSQEHCRGDYNRRHGTCYCLDCGSDLSADHRNCPLEELMSLAIRINAYTRDHTPLSVDHRRFAREVSRMKSHRDKTGYETEILAVAFARSITQRAPAAGDSSTHSVSAD